MTAELDRPPLARPDPAPHWSLRWDGGDPEGVPDLHALRAVLDERRRRPGAAGAVAWANLERGQGSELASLAVELHLDDEALEDLTGPMERAKLDVGSDVAVVVTRGWTFDAQTCRLDTFPVSAVVADGVLITVADADPFLPAFNRRVSRCIGTVTVGHLLFELLDLVVDGYKAVYEAVADAVDELSERVFEDKPLTREEQITSFHLRRSLTVMRRIGLPMRDVTAAMAQAARENGADTGDWLTTQLPTTGARRFDDIAEHVAHINEGVDGLREVMSTLVIRVGTAISAAQLASFFITVLSRTSASDRFVSISPAGDPSAADVADVGGVQVTSADGGPGMVNRRRCPRHGDRHRPPGRLAEVVPPRGPSARDHRHRPEPQQRSVEPHLGGRRRRRVPVHPGKQ